MSSMIHVQACGHLLRADRQEDLCFALWYPSQGRARTTALIHELLLPLPGERQVHGNAGFFPGYFERALGAALEAGAGLALLHSHLGPGWQAMSEDDHSAEAGHAGAAKGATGLPLLGLTLGTDGAWSSRFWERAAARRYEARWCTSVRVVGDRLDVTYANQLLPPPGFRPELSRTISAWGERAQAGIARLRVGIVGAGSVGSIVAEAMARMGIAYVLLLDFDGVELENLDRLLHASRRDAALYRSKVEVLARGLRRSATAANFTVDALEWSVVEEEGFRAALDCDVLFSCVDRPWPRYVLNFIAHAHLIPVVDGGVHVEAKPGGNGLRGADWRAHVASPTRRCLQCLGQYDPGLVSVERDGYLDDPAYISGLPESHPVRHNENVFGFGLGAASLEVLQFLSMLVAPRNVPVPGAQLYRFVRARLEADDQRCDAGCPFPTLTARGDRAVGAGTGRHPRAELAREARRKIQTSWRIRLAEWADGVGARLTRF